jgi:hypothetical protein
MSRFLKKIRDSLKERPLLYVLLGILLIIVVVSIRPGYALLGWDNYSSYLNPQINIVRMFLDAWRSFRGLGVPSDSESTDIFRQFIFLILSPFISTDLLDQIYFLGSLVTGVLTTYIFVSRIMKRGERVSQYADLGGFVAGFFYLFNLNTLSVFYFPITPYISRFFTIPVLLLALDYVFHTKKFSAKAYLLLLFAVFFSAPSYVIGTVFVTLVMVLGLFVLFQKQFLKAVAVMTVFFLLNAFWIFPFINYTIQKSGIIRLAPTFISANETQLNKPQSFYDIKKQMILWPNFFETQVTSLRVDRADFLHPLAESIDSGWQYSIFALFPILYILGSIIILMTFRKNWQLLWAPLVVFLFLFLSMKEFSWFGFIYRFLDTYVPYFGVVFRFGDTKFHPYLAFAGSVSAGFAVVFLMSKLAALHKHVALTGKIVFLSLLILTTSIVYRAYFSGDFIGFYMYNKVPDAYNVIATRINADPDPVRVVHLPYDDEVYWRSYSWGYVGSSFLYYMLDKPLFEKTFEPASMENAYVNEKIQRIVHNSQSLSGADLEMRSQELYELLSMLGVRYIIFDETVQTAQPSRGINLWGMFNTEEARTLLAQLEDDERISKSYTGYVSMSEYLKYYDKVLPIDRELRGQIEEAEPQEIILYEIADPAPHVSFLPEASHIDPYLEDQLLAARSIEEGHTIQFDKNSILYPFLRKDGALEKSNNDLLLTLENIPSGEYQLQTAGESTSTHLIRVSARLTEEDLVIETYLQYLPSIDDQEFLAPVTSFSVPRDEVEDALARRTPSEQFRSNWPVLVTEVTDLRLSVNGIVLPVPPIDAEVREIGTVMIEGTAIDFQVLTRDQVVEIDPTTLQLTENPNCYGDALNNYSSKQEAQNGKYRVSSVNGSTCFWRDLATEFEEGVSHLELAMDIDSSQKSLDEQYIKPNSFSSKPQLTSYVQSLQKPNLFEICVKEYNVPDCYNSAQLFALPAGERTIRIPSTQSVSDIQDLLVQFVVKNTQYQEQSVEISRLSLETYIPIDEVQFTMVIPEMLEGRVDLVTENLQIQIPQSYGQTSYRFDDPHDALYVSSDPCGASDTYRTFRFYKNTWISYAENCQNRIFARLPFDSRRMYLWSVDYNLTSGQYPRMIMKDGFYRYTNELMSLHQGYPEVAGFHEFQDPELPFQQGFTPLDELKMRNTYSYIYPRAEYYDEKAKEFAIEHFSENEAMMLISGFSVTELPSSWETLKLIPTSGESTVEYSVPQNVSLRSILPSLKKITLEEGAQENGSVLLKFNEGYDAQWGVSHSVLGALMGQDISQVHARCDGYANCFELSAGDITTGKTLYLYYFPQTLSFIGWIVTLSTIGGVALYIHKKK